MVVPIVEVTQTLPSFTVGCCVGDWVGVTVGSYVGNAPFSCRNVGFAVNNVFALDSVGKEVLGVDDG